MSNPDIIERHLSVQDETSAIDLLAATTRLSRQQLKRAMSNGAAWLETATGIERIRRAKRPLRAGDTLHLYYAAGIQAQTPPEAELVEDLGDYSVWIKPAGMFSQGSKWGDHCTLYRWAEQHLEPQRPAWIVHRLDRAANGLMLLAHNRKTASALAGMFERHQITKRYRAIVEGDLELPSLPFTIDSPVDGKQAESIIIGSDEAGPGTTALTLEISSGRKHQVREHLSGLGHPIVGDRLFGAADIGRDLQLTACVLAFTCPVSGVTRRWELPAREQDTA